MAMRTVRHEVTVKFKPKDGFRVDIPEALLDLNVNERARVMSLWKGFRKSAASICGARYSFLMNRTYRKTVFATQMDKLCKDFGRRTENLKVVFEVVPRSRNKKKVDYQLKFLQLSDIPDSCRFARYCTAEIPPVEAQAYGEYVSDRYDTGFAFLVEQMSTEGGPGRIIPNAPIEILDDRRTPIPTVYISEESEEYQNMFHPPLANAVIAAGIVEVESEEEDGEGTDDGDDNEPVFAVARLAGNNDFVPVSL